MMRLHFLNDVANDVDSTKQKQNVRLKSETMGKLMNRIPDIPNLPGFVLIKNHVESLSKPHNSTSITKALPDKLDIKSNSPSIQNYQECVFRYQVYQSWLGERILNLSASLTIKEAFSKPCLVN